MISRFYKKTRELEINQADIFYNYCLGTASSSINLLKTATFFLKKGLTRLVFFSDLKILYIDDVGEIQVGIIEIEKNTKDAWTFNLDVELPTELASYVVMAMEILFHENRLCFEKDLYLRIFLPPVVLKDSFSESLLDVSAKIYSNGIIILSYEYSATWSSITVDDFIEDFVNLYIRDFESIWVNSKIQEMDAEVVLKDNFDDLFSFADFNIQNRKTKKSIKRMKNKGIKALKASLSKEGKIFKHKDNEWILHQIVGSENSNNLKFELCREMYSNVLSQNIVVNDVFEESYIWEGRPSISLLRFNNQPESKKKLFQYFSHSLMKVLYRVSVDINNPNLLNLAPDLRMFEDYSLHVDRSLFLWTRLRAEEEENNFFAENGAYSVIMENQMRAEQLEYYNMLIVRACNWAHFPSTDEHLMTAYEVLSNYEILIRHSSQSGEIINTISYMIDACDTKKLIPSAKEAAKFHLDEAKYRVNIAQGKNSRNLTLIFGFVGITSFSEFISEPIIKNFYPLLSEVQSSLLSFLLSSFSLFIIILIVWLSNKFR